MGLQAVIFDKDGVLVDSELGKMKAMKEALAELGYSDINGFRDWYLGRVGVSGIESCQMCVDNFNLVKIPDSNVLYERTENIRKGMLEGDPAPLIENSIQFLRLVHERGIKIGVASSDFPENIRKHMEQAGIFDYISAITSGEKNSGQVTHDKPDPEVYLVTAKNLGVDPKYCIGIEDTTPGVQSVKAAGMYCIGYKNENSGNQDLTRAGADKVTDNLYKIGVRSLHSLVA